jgi:hypothetical protein
MLGSVRSVSLRRVSRHAGMDVRMIDSALLVASISACSLLCAFSSPSPYVISIEMPRSPSRQYTISSSSVVLRLLTYRLRSVVLN